MSGGLTQYPLSEAPFELKIAQGLVPGVSAVTKFGRNPDVDVGTEDIWFQGGTFVPPTAARIHNIVGGAADTAAGTGARTVTIQGLDANYLEISETVTMNGAGGVNTANSYIIIHRAFVATAGSGGVNSADLVATAAVDATVSFRIAAGKGQTQLCFYQVPAGKTAYITRFGGSMDGGSNANVDLELFVTPFGGALNLKGTVMFQGSGTTMGQREYSTPLQVLEKSLIRIRAISDTVNMDIVGNFDLYLVDN